MAVSLCRRIGGEVVSADSRQVYRGMDIGTGKDYHEYGTDKDRITAHLLDVADPAAPYHLRRFVSEARQAILDIAEQQKLPVIAGGTPLYINALLDRYRLEGGQPDEHLRKTLHELSDRELLTLLKTEAPDIYERVDSTQRRRIIRGIEIARTRTLNAGTPEPLTLNSLILAPYFPRHILHKRIEARLDKRLQQGLVDEVRRLHEQWGLSWERLEFFGLEYRCAAQYLQGIVSFNAFREQLLARIRRFCKAQDVWFRKMERAGKDIYWIEGGDIDAAQTVVETFLSGEPLPRPSFRLNNIRYGPRQ